MKGLKYLLPGIPKIWIVIFVILFITLSCHRGCRYRGCSGCSGCTTSVVVDDEVRKIKVDGIHIKVRANKNRVTNRKLIFDQNLLVDKNVWYSVDYDIRLEQRKALRNLCEYEVPENQDLDRSLDKFQIKFSPDKRHFAVGLDKKVYDFFHLLSHGVPFSSGCYYLNDPNYTFISTAELEFDDIKWNKFPKPETLFDTIIIPNYYASWNYPHNKTNILELLDEMPPGNEHEIVLIKNWYCEIADLHFQKYRVEQILRVSPQWKNEAKISLVRCIDNSFSESNPELSASLNMVLWINDNELLNKADSIVFKDYFAKNNAGNYLVDRYKDLKNPLNNTIKNLLLKEAKRICSGTYTYSETMSAAIAVDFLLISKEYEVLKTFIEKNVKIEVLTEDFTDISYATIDKYNEYPVALKTLMVNNYHKVALIEENYLSSFDIVTIVDFLKDKISCSELKKIVKMHGNNMPGFIMPAKCK